MGADLSLPGFASILAIYSGSRNVTKNFYHPPIFWEIKNTSAEEEIHEVIFSPIRKETHYQTCPRWHDNPRTFLTREAK